MQFSFKAVVVLIGLSFATSSYGWNLCDLLCGSSGDSCGCGNGNCGDGCEPGCGCEPSCGCEAGCGCEPSCGCGGYCVNGRQYAGQTYNGGCDDECGRGVAYEPDCGCEPSCGCEDNRDSGGCCTGLFRACHRMCQALCGGCSGCSSEAYWCEWHNDPPRCSDPCDRCGNWIGPSGGCGCECGGGYSAPYDHSFSGGESGYSTGQRPGRAHGGTTVAAGQRPGQAASSSAIARGTVNPYTKARAMRKPLQGTQKQYQR